MNSTDEPRSLRRGALAVLFALGLVTPLTAQVPDPIMPVSAVKPGMKGVGKTVWQGTKIETFDVTVISVMRNFEPKRDIILARLSGPAIDRYGVVAGMSGSPVYIDGKVIGAVSLGWPFQREPICGITPIEQMKGVLEMPSPPVPGTPGLAPAGEAAPRGDGRSTGGLPMGLAPIRTPLLLTGVPQETVKRLQDRFEAVGLMPMQGGAGSPMLTPPGADAMQPGSAVGVSLVSGDLAMDAVGTLTYRDGDRFVAFGHPFLGLGDTAMPVGPAFVHAVMPSMYVSFKLAAAAAPVGTMRQDRPPAIMGEIGRVAPQFPLKVDITAPAGARAFSFEVANAGPMTPMLLLMVVDAAITQVGRVAGEQSFATRLEMKLPGRPALTYENMFSTRDDHLAAVMEMLTPVMQVLTNKFEPVPIESLSVRIEAQERVREARIESVRLERTELERGETAEVAVILRTYSGQREAVRLPFRVPLDAAPGAAQLHVSDAVQARGRAQHRNPGRYQPQSLSGLLTMGQEERHNNEVVMQLLLPRDGVSYGTTELPRLPASALSVISSSGLSGFKNLQSEVEVRQATRNVVLGAEMLEIRIREQKQP